ncbi:type II toxin-antitoxin system antitoxin, RelB/DinJ family [Bifidobacterium sp. ESL0704]|uniref:type II toxin-antitoxin system antitoxin, RelB/DinJ family n=1 Tax=Bifidobacterium sp. ESL0704 TaxID=2983219 RepID=UPI0023F9A908|nr:type II toxin-antitoxin system antitoxin, RelB/DinJ family [Bifidobacterium sp. ESL0704]WEV52864.1 type II toxin-antitoxin system antitoxin, RelB/DinJ family [Bifidobacterium sp. ESL0704]
MKNSVSAYDNQGILPTVGLNGLGSIGLDTSGAINIFLRQVIGDQGLSFRPKRDAVNARARYEAEHHIGKTFNSANAPTQELDNA